MAGDGLGAFDGADAIPVTLTVINWLNTKPIKPSNDSAKVCNFG